MTTAEARKLAMEAASECQWDQAARLMRYAVSCYPFMPRRSIYTPAQMADIEKMTARAVSWEKQAEQEAAL